MAIRLLVYANDKDFYKMIFILYSLNLEMEIVDTII